jgi:YHS domain-containing protein
MKKTLLILIVLMAALSLTAVGWSQTKSDTGKPQTTCPVLGGMINKSIYTDYQGKRIYFCCAGCVGEFKKNPEKYMKKMESEGVKLPSLGGE